MRDGGEVETGAEGAAPSGDLKYDDVVSGFEGIEGVIRGVEHFGVECVSFFGMVENAGCGRCFAICCDK